VRRKIGEVGAHVRHIRDWADAGRQPAPRDGEHFNALSAERPDRVAADEARGTRHENAAWLRGIRF